MRGEGGEGIGVVAVVGFIDFEGDGDGVKERAWHRRCRRVGKHGVEGRCAMGEELCNAKGVGFPCFVRALFEKGFDLRDERGSIRFHAVFSAAHGGFRGRLKPGSDHNIAKKIAGGLFLFNISEKSLIAAKQLDRVGFVDRCTNRLVVYFVDMPKDKIPVNVFEIAGVHIGRLSVRFTGKHGFHAKEGQLRDDVTRFSAKHHHDIGEVLVAISDINRRRAETNFRRIEPLGEPRISA